MSRSRFTMSGLVALVAAAGLGLTACHSGSSAASSPPATATSAAAANAAATTTPASSGTAAASTPTASSSLTISGGNVGYFPTTVGDTWVYQISTSAGQVGTATNRVTSAGPTSGGTLVTIADNTVLAGVPVSHTFQYVIHSDGSISVPVSSTGTDVTVVSGQLTWPNSAQLAAGQPVKDTLVFSDDDGGKTSTYTTHATIKGEGTQSVTVPAGTYSATDIDEVLTATVSGISVNTNVQTWVANGVGPVKEEVSSVEGSYTSTITQVLKSFTQG